VTELLSLTPDELLSTTRAVRRRLDFDRPVPLTLVMECIALAQQAPTGGNSQGWSFLVIDDPAVKAGLAALYKRSFEVFISAGMFLSTAAHQDERTLAQTQRVYDSSAYIADNIGRSPYLVVLCGTSPEGRLEGATSFGNIMPAGWSFLLAARARGLGTVWTTNHLRYEEEAAELLGIPYDEVTQVMMTPVAYTIGTDFKPAYRPAPETITRMNHW
jgi:nitroreductase